MDQIVKLLERIVPGGQRPTDADLRKGSAILTLAVMVMAGNMVSEALASLATTGMSISQFTFSSFMGYAARLQWEKLSALGLTRLDKLGLHHTARTKKFLKANAHISNTEDFTNVAFFLDVAEYMVRHFIPTKRLATMMATPGVITALPAEKLVNPAPSSDEALKCLAAVNPKSFATVKTRQVALEPVTVGEMLQEVSLKVEEAARIIRVAPKTLEDMCRDGRYPESSYKRHAENGTYHFPTAQVVAFAENRDARTLKTRR